MGFPGLALLASARRSLPALAIALLAGVGCTSSDVPGGCCCPLGEEASIGCACSHPSPGGGGDVNALIQGFGVVSFPLRRDPNTPDRPVFSWTPLDETVDVRCALFQCQPLVESASNSSTARDKLWSIVNFSSCVLAYKDLSGSSGLFDLTDPDIFLDPPQTCSGDAKALPTRLFAGCWSFDEIDVAGATTLIPVHASELATNPRTSASFAARCTTSDADTGAPGPTCDVAGRSDGLPSFELGTCRGEVCRHRCSTNEDCPLKPESDQHEACEATFPGSLGLCKEE
jgi:hypothetical protein